jgi:hypothetical protein
MIGMTETYKAAWNLKYAKDASKSSWCNSRKRSDFHAAMDRAYRESLHQLLQLSAWKPSQLIFHLEAH